jgi:hypothetical protein
MQKDEKRGLLEQNLNKSSDQGTHAVSVLDMGEQTVLVEQRV